MRNKKYTKDEEKIYDVESKKERKGIQKTRGTVVPEACPGYPAYL